MTRLEVAKSGTAATRKWMAVFALLAFFFQSLAVQTHIHPQPASLTVKAASTHNVDSRSGSAPLKNQDPVDQCRLCQELVHAGYFVAPLATVTLGDLNFAPAIFAALVLPKDHSAPAFAWQGRAPPVR